MFEKLGEIRIDVCDFANITAEDIDRLGMSYFDATRLWENAVADHEVKKEVGKKSWWVPRWFVYARILISRLKRDSPETINQKEK